MIYLDHNATTPLDEEVRKAIAGSFPLFGNPSSSHAAGAAAKEAVERARQRVAQLLACDPREVVFTSGGTESNNLAIIGTARKFRGGHIITSEIEHPSVLNPVRWLELNGFKATYLPVDAGGRIYPGDLKKAVRKDTVLITIMHANNETGVLQPVREIGEIAWEHDIPFHSDAAQSVGKMDVHVPDLRVDMLTVVSHKFYGPKGIGALYIKGFSGVGHDERVGASSASRVPAPIIFGAGHEGGMRPGTENILGIAGLGAACETAARSLPERYERALKLRDRLFNLLHEELDIRLNGHEALRLPNTLNISIKGIAAEDLILVVRDRIALSSGSACHSGMRKPSPVLKAMGISDEDALASVRLSVGKDNTSQEIDEAAKIIIPSVKGLLRPS